MKTITRCNIICQRFISRCNMTDKTKWRKRLKELRQRRGLSQIELSVLSKVAQPTISQYEKGQREFTEKTLGMILDALHADYSNLFCDCSDHKRAKDPNDLDATKLRSHNVVSLKKKRA